MGKIIITGPGRSGTTFLVQLLTRLGFDTGFEPYNEEGYRENLRAGLEWPLLAQIDFSKQSPDEIRTAIDKAPRILKGPDWSLIIKRLLMDNLIQVDSIILPVRDLETAARSRLAVGLDWMVMEGGDDEARIVDQANVSAMALGRAIETCLLYSIPCVLMTFPLLVQSARYCYDKLEQAFPLSWGSFIERYDALANPKQIVW